MQTTLHKRNKMKVSRREVMMFVPLSPKRRKVTAQTAQPYHAPAPAPYPTVLELRQRCLQHTVRAGKVEAYDALLIKTMNIAVEQKSPLQHAVEVIPSLLIRSVMGLDQYQQQKPLCNHRRSIAKQLSSL